MKKLVPFKKEIAFKTNIDEITSISLEHSLQPVDSHMISGSFLVSGEYKITDTSVSTEVFHFELPFDITLDERYGLEHVTVDIDDFYYEIVNEDVLVVHIEVLIDHLEEVVQEEEPVRAEDTIVVQEIQKIDLGSEDLEIEEVVEEVEEPVVMVQEATEVIEKGADMVEDVGRSEVTSAMETSIFDSFNEQETYMTYKVYILREGDSIEGVMQKYSITKEQLEMYNDLKEVKLGDKLIIPSIYHEQA